MALASYFHARSTSIARLAGLTLVGLPFDCSFSSLRMSIFWYAIAVYPFMPVDCGAKETLPSVQAFVKRYASSSSWIRRSDGTGPIHLRGDCLEFICHNVNALSLPTDAEIFDSEYISRGNL
jgi:hypothetical protein